MKFTMNGALTIGTLDGANIEIREEVGDENFFLFGLTVDEIQARRAAGYQPRRFYQEDPELRAVLDLLVSDALSGGNRSRFQPLVDSLLGRDDYMLLADYRAYVDCQDQVSAAYLDQESWTRMSILNTARMGKFSSDRSIPRVLREHLGREARAGDAGVARHFDSGIGRRGDAIVAFRRGESDRSEPCYPGRRVTIPSVSSSQSWAPWPWPAARPRLTTSRSAHARKRLA